MFEYPGHDPSRDFWLKAPRPLALPWTWGEHDEWRALWQSGPLSPVLESPFGVFGAIAGAAVPVVVSEGETMGDKDTLWTAVKAAYDADVLLPLTGIHDRASSSMGAAHDVVGTAAAQQAIDYFPLYVEAAFLVDDSQHLAVAIRGTYAVLLERGGVSSAIAAKEFQEVWGEEGLAQRLRRISARGRRGPSTSGPDVSSGIGEVKPWSRRGSMPTGFMPQRRGAFDNDEG